MPKTESSVARVAVVTGGSRGIGRAVCVQLAQMGMNVCVGYAGNANAAAETIALCGHENARAIAVQADVATAAGCEALFAAAMKEFGRVDVLVNNAGITKDNLILRLKEEDFDRVVDTNLKGAFLCSKAAAKIMLRQRYGRIINISSVVGLHGNAGQTNYAASKAGLVGLTKSLAKELASRNVTANVVAPGFIDTDMTQVMPQPAKDAALAAIPLARMGSAQDVARAVAFFAAEENAYITGQVLSVDGGMGM